MDKHLKYFKPLNTDEGMPPVETRKKPTLVLTRDEFEELYDLFKSEIPRGDTTVRPDMIGFFLTKSGKQEIIIDFAKVEYEDIGEYGRFTGSFFGHDGGGDPPLFPVRKG